MLYGCMSMHTLWSVDCVCVCVRACVCVRVRVRMLVCSDVYIKFFVYVQKTSSKIFSGGAGTEKVEQPAKSQVLRVCD